MSTATWARELLATALAALGNTEDVTGTLDLAEAASALSAGQLVVCPRPPALEVPTWHELTATWEIILAAGPSDQTVAAWDRLDAALFALLEPLAVEETRPDAFLDNQSTTWPAMVLTTTSQHTRTY